MGIARMTKAAPWYDFYPVSERFVVSSPSDPLLVDIGGGLGHDVIAFQKRHPGIAGKLIVQDIPVVISDIKDLPNGIEVMKHDFFMPQPIKNSTVYFMRNILHDWPNKQAMKILGSIRNAMGPQSLLLVDENVLPESGVPLFSAQFDIAMMALFSSLERTQAQYTKLLEDAGLEVLKAWPQPGGTAMLFEAALKK
jgi:hypothetical protein